MSVYEISDNAMPQTILIRVLGVSDPSVVCIPKTNVAESALVIKNTDTKTNAIIDNSVPIGITSNMANNCFSTGKLKICGCLSPVIIPAAPTTLNPTIQTGAATNTTARINSRIVRPRDPRAINIPTAGLQLDHQPR